MSGLWLKNRSERDLRSGEVLNLSSYKQSPEKNSEASTGRPHDLRDSGAMLYRALTSQLRRSLSLPFGLLKIHF